MRVKSGVIPLKFINNFPKNKQRAKQIATG